MATLHNLHRVTETPDPRHETEAFGRVDHEDQTDPAGIGSVLLIALAFLLFALFCVWCAAVTAGVPVEDVLREIWEAGRRHTQ